MTKTWHLPTLGECFGPREDWRGTEDEQAEQDRIAEQAVPPALRLDATQLKAIRDHVRNEDMTEQQSKPWPTHIPHNSLKGWQEHQRRNQPACPSCSYAFVFARARNELADTR